MKYTCETYTNPFENHMRAMLTLTHDRREQTTGPKFHKMFKNFKIIENHYYLWNHRGKCIQTSTNMPSIGLVICEIVIEINQIRPLVQR